MAVPEVSVLVPTRDRPKSLVRCLRALERQTIGSVLEIVVVDDGSADGETVESLVAQTPCARLIRQPPSGVAAARNAGARAARAPFVCLTDDDCDPVPDWAEHLRAALEAGADVVAGPTVNARPGDSLAEATQTIVNYLAERASELPSLTPFAPGSNLGFTAETVRALPFDERYGPGGEDRDWCARVVRSGRTLVWDAEAVVRHFQQLTLQSFLAKHLNWGRGAHRFRRAHPAVPLLEAPRFYAGLVARGFERGPVTGALVCLAQLATAAGYVDDALTGPQRGDGGQPRRRSA